jgi:hypothetical protein
MSVERSLLLRLGCLRRLLGLGVRLLRLSLRLFWVPFPPGFQSLLETSIVESVENQLEGDSLLNYQARIQPEAVACETITYPVIQPLYFSARRQKIAEE